MIVRDAWPFIIIGLVLTLLLLAGALRLSSLSLLVVASVFALLTVFTSYFFRNPPRTIPDDQYAIVAPADGRIVMITSVPDHPFVGGPAIRISIFLSVFDVHLNRLPMSGTIDYVRYNPGKFFAAFEDKASELNEQTEVGMTTVDGHRLTFSQIAGLIARRIVCRLAPGDVVNRGELYGLIRFGSRVDLTVPEDWEIAVRIGDRVTGGETVMAHMRISEDAEKASQQALGDDVDL